ncbi:MAG: AmmeMemoRadiSam system radical SAM enzyme [Magnetococcales bacterium]|nr:AmmeMemoRadiSam system radical SAM enzyme [Magnetococcales bacterium]MBF0322638.1 AmmeMemoRadiSam system radical SAM enzyme [Magnetococcales bacterium]
MTRLGTSVARETITLADPGVVATHYWRTLPDGRIQCDVCPRICRLREGQRGLCYVRARTADQIVLTSHGRSHGFCIDPIEKKPLYHFYPGSAILSFGTAGCNLACKFCQNWHMSRSRSMDEQMATATPAQLAAAAQRLGCRSLAYTYNDPVVFMEYAMDVAQAGHALGIQSVAVTAGYMQDAAREAFYRHMDAANVDLKAFSERFYRRLCGGSLQPVLETLQYIHAKTDVWLEITTLLIPGENDSDAELESMTQWVATHLSVDVPIHFSAFHPAYRLQEKPRTPAATLTRARHIARNNGLRYVYTGNLHDPAGGVTHCHACGHQLIVRDGYTLLAWHLTHQGDCATCGTSCAGTFAAAPENWGARCVPVRV